MTSDLRSPASLCVTVGAGVWSRGRRVSGPQLAMLSKEAGGKTQKQECKGEGTPDLGWPHQSLLTPLPFHCTVWPNPNPMDGPALAFLRRLWGSQALPEEVTQQASLKSPCAHDQYPEMGGQCPLATPCFPGHLAGPSDYCRLLHSSQTATLPGPPHALGR